MQHKQRKLPFPATGLLSGLVMAFGLALSATAAETPAGVNGATPAVATRLADKGMPPGDASRAKVAYADKTTSGVNEVKAGRSKPAADKSPTMLFYCSGASCYQLLEQFVVDGK